jgi:prolyl-tRNA editing enzyme YbaK/EbsC (Cys-tRNA(Pro) deacylase)
VSYFPLHDSTFQIRTVGAPTSVIAAVRQAAREVDANLPLYNIKTLVTQIDESLVQERLIGTLSSAFGLLSLSLASIGLYGIMAYAVSQRTHEIGVRNSACFTIRLRDNLAIWRSQCSDCSAFLTTGYLERGALTEQCAQSLPRVLDAVALRHDQVRVNAGAVVRGLTVVVA